MGLVRRDNSPLTPRAGYSRVILDDYRPLRLEYDHKDNSGLNPILFIISQEGKMSNERPKDILDWRYERAKEIKKVLKQIPFKFALISDKKYDLGPYEIIRLVNIFATSNNLKHSLEAFLKMKQRSEKMYEIPYLIKVIGEKKKKDNQ